MSLTSSRLLSASKLRSSPPTPLLKRVATKESLFLPNISMEKFIPISFDCQQELPLPSITAKSWSISTGKNGESLWNKAPHERLEMASLTKIMTAYLVCVLSDRVHLNLNITIIKITKPMVMISGTTGNLKEGDHLSLVDLLYGLLLPSGNDCALALASYFGFLLLEKFLRGVKSHVKISFDQSVKRFIKEMNIQAMRLTLKSTSFANVHGLSHKGNKSTAEELGKLAYHLLKNSLLREIINKKTHEISIFNILLNQTRTLLWTNTNKLLWKKGFFGLKTGTTPNAGACLIVLYIVEEIELIITLLACNSTHHRWEEAKILADWGYKNYNLMGIKQKRRLLKTSSFKKLIIN